MSFYDEEIKCEMAGAELLEDMVQGASACPVEESVPMPEGKNDSQKLEILLSLIADAIKDRSIILTPNTERSSWPELMLLNSLLVDYYYYTKED